MAEREIKENEPIRASVSIDANEIDGNKKSDVEPAVVPKQNQKEINISKNA